MLTHSPKLNKLAAALVAVQKEMTKAIKTARNPNTGSVYADLEHVIDACRPALLAHDIAVVQTPYTFGVHTLQTTVTVTTVLTHTSGQWLSSDLTLPVEAPADAQAIGSAITYARRYALESIVGIARTDDDGNAASAPVYAVMVREIADALTALDCDEVTRESIRRKLSQLSFAQQLIAVRQHQTFGALIEALFTEPGGIVAMSPRDLERMREQEPVL